MVLFFPTVTTSPSKQRLSAFFCSGAKIQTLSVYVFSKIKDLLDPTINALSACMLAISSLLVIILSMFKVVDQVISNE